MSPAFETARMFRREPPPVDAALAFGVTSYELG